MKKAQCPFLRRGEACFVGGVPGELSDPGVVSPNPILDHDDMFPAKAMSCHAEGKLRDKLCIDKPGRLLRGEKHVRKSSKKRVYHR